MSPVISKSQYRFMKAITSGSIKKPGLSKEKAEEFIKATPDVKELPERVKFKKLKNALRKK